MKTLCDSDILIDFFKKKSSAVELMKDLHKQGIVAISVLSVAELRVGWTKDEARELLPHFKKAFQIEPVTFEVAALGGELRREYRNLSGHLLPTIDSLIAATALLHTYTLVTRNVKDYAITGLKHYPLSE